MLPYLSKNIPIVFLYNNIESFFDFLNRSEAASLPRQAYIPNRQYSKGDRALLSLGDSKLIYASAAVPHANDLCDDFHFPHTDYLFPANPSPWLSLDILQEPLLLNRLVEYAGPGRTVQLVAYATTRQFLQLVDKLRTDCGLTVLLPESPLPGSEWVRDYIDTKSGFRSLASYWLPNARELIPEGLVCNTMFQAAQVGNWYCLQGKACVIKADGGESGIGQHIFRPGTGVTVESILARIQPDPYLHNDLIIVEEYIPSTNHLSPSLEVYVPPPGEGEPCITYLSNQLFLGDSDFYGLLISREQTQSPWYSILAESGLKLAHHLQDMGYAGHFDLDTIVDDADRIYLIELNPRRTAGTHVHEFAYHFFGPDYLDHFVLLSINKIRTGTISHFDDLKSALSDLLYPIMGQQKGIIFSVTSILPAHEFGCIIVATSIDEVTILHQQLRDRLQRATIQRPV
jgi:hypothetical protein